MKNYYTGIGSRKTPAPILQLMSFLGGALAKKGYVLRSGGAQGADETFEAGLRAATTEEIAESLAEIYLPWPRFRGNASPLYQVAKKALVLAKSVHPMWDTLPDSVRKLHARNCYQVLGADLQTPAEFVVCWTPDGCDSEATRNSQTGGTGTAIALATRNGIPVYNLGNPGSCLKLDARLKEIGIEMPWGANQLRGPTLQPAAVQMDLFGAPLKSGSRNGF